MWCKDNNLSLKVIKTKKMKTRTEHATILNNGAIEEQVESFRFLGVHITNKVQAHHDSREEGMTKPIPPQETKKIWHGSSDPQKVLELHHPDGLHHCLVWQMLEL